MRNKQKVISYESPIASLMERFVREKKACGYKYEAGAWGLKRFDEFLCYEKLKTQALPKALILKWLEKRHHETASTQQHRVGLVRQFAFFMVKAGYSAYVPPEQFGPRQAQAFTPRILTHKEIKKLLQAVDRITPSVKVPWRHIVMPELFRLLYGCGFRLSEVLNLRIKDVDLARGVITVRDAKFGKDRLVPPALDLVKRLRIYVDRMDEAILEKPTEDSFFFPSGRWGTHWHSSTVYCVFRKLLHQCNIPHPGRGKGPRVHDLRHTFAVHRLIRWYEEDVDLNAKLPLLVAYLGHQDFTGTQKYLHLTAELFPNLTERMNKQFGGVIPRGR